MQQSHKLAKFCSYGAQKWNSYAMGDFTYCFCKGPIYHYIFKPSLYFARIKSNEKLVLSIAQWFGCLYCDQILQFEFPKCPCFWAMTVRSMFLS